MFPQPKLAVAALLAVALGVVSHADVARAQAADAACPGNPDALGVSRTLIVSAGEYARLGQMQYRHTLPLNDHEVVLTFDDGPLPPYTTRVLSALAHECVKATFFIVGRMAAAYPDTLRLEAELGHTIGNHSQNHPIHFNAISEMRAESEVENGMRTIKAVLGSDGTLAPFFRVPGLGRTHAIEQYLRSRQQIVWSSDTLADDWTRITSASVLHRALSRLEARGRGILLLHDIQARTAMMLPELLRELKTRGFRVVHVVPDKAAPQPVPTPPDVMIASAPMRQPWPRVLPDNAPAVALAAKAETAGQAGANEMHVGSAAELPARRKQRHHVRHAKKRPKGVQTAT